jgi:hypothetical protein
MTERDSSIKGNVTIHYCKEKYEKLIKRFFRESVTRVFSLFAVVPHERRGLAVSMRGVGMQRTVFILLILRELYDLSLAILFCWVLPSVYVLSLFFLSLHFFLYLLYLYLVDCNTCNTSCYVFIVITCLRFGRSCVKFRFIGTVYS